MDETIELFIQQGINRLSQLQRGYSIPHNPRIASYLAGLLHEPMHETDRPGPYLRTNNGCAYREMSWLMYFPQNLR
ncbi:hypothetical protein D1872_253760 [compost metagenome]